MRFYCSEKDTIILRDIMDAKCVRADISRALLIRTAIKAFCKNPMPWYDLFNAESNDELYKACNILKAIMKKKGIENES